MQGGVRRDIPTNNKTWKNKQLIVSLLKQYQQLGFLIPFEIGETASYFDKTQYRTKGI